MQCVMLSMGDQPASTVTGTKRPFEEDSDSAQPAAAVIEEHAGINCDGCQMKPVIGACFRRQALNDSEDFCQKCYDKLSEDAKSSLRRISGRMIKQEAPAIAVDSDEADLAAAMALSMQTDDEAMPVVASPVPEPAEPTEVEFERFDGDSILIDETAVKNINEYCSSVGEQYVDPQFPPTNRSLYIDPNDADQWKCFGCQAVHKLPAVPDLPSSQEDLDKLNHDITTMACPNCRLAAPNIAKSSFANRPCQWRRPGTACDGCNMIFGHLPNGKDLVTRMCTHYLRDQVAQTTLGMPWALIRESARPEDVCQGAIGNCWFAGALSVVAAYPELISKLFVTKHFNPAGAYQIKLHHSGEWKGVLIDDLLPSSKIFEGYTDGNMIHYSRGGTLSYLMCARRQLWVPLLEKASAKLFGSYAGLVSGTFSEALQLFTGFPSERIELYVRAEVVAKRQERKQRIIEERTQRLLRGEALNDNDDLDDDDQNDDLLWSKMLSYKEAGYVMGMGCTAEGCEKTKEEIVEGAGLQAPHAYGVLDVREVQVNGQAQRLVQIRNPWGEKAPLTWKGDWGKDSALWTHQLKRELGVVNHANVPMYDQMGIFWMNLTDVKRYFAALEVCRVHQGWHEQRQKLWLPSAVGPGQCVSLTVFQRTQLDLALWQERHITRESAAGGASTNVDVGLAVLRKRGDQTAEGPPEYECVHYIKRTRQDACSGELILDGGFTYTLVPLCFNQMEVYAPRKAVLAVHSSKPVEIEKSTSTWRDVAFAVAEGAKKAGNRKGLGNDVQAFMIEESDGISYCVQNDSDTTFGLQVVMLLTFATGAMRCGMAFASEVPDPAIVARTPPTPPPQAVAETIEEEDPDLAAALQLSLAGPELLPDNAQAGGADPDDELAQAIALSLATDVVSVPEPAPAPPEQAAAAPAPPEQAAAAPAPPEQAAAAPAPPEQAAAAPSENLKAKHSALVKKYFTQYCSNGTPPNEAAVLAMKKARDELGGVVAVKPPKKDPADIKAQLRDLVKKLFAQYTSEGMPANQAAVVAMKAAKEQLGI